MTGKGEEGWRRAHRRQVITRGEVRPPPPPLSLSFHLFVSPPPASVEKVLEVVVWEEEERRLVVLFGEFKILGLNLALAA